MSQKYSIKSEVREGVEIFALCEADRAYAEVAPQFGNNCFAFRVQEPILEPVPFEEFRQRPTSFGIPILFPFPNRIRDGEFYFRGQRYAVNPNRHGFVRDKAWRVLGAGADDREGAWIKSSVEAAQYAEQILGQFPFPFRLEVTYRLKDGRLEMDTVAQNVGEREAPVGFGIHPYFACSAQATIQIPARKRWELLDSLPTGKLLEVEGSYDLRQPREVAGLVLDDIFTELVADSDGLVRCVLDDRGKGMQTIVEFDAGQFPNVVVYTPPAPRQAICIEPYTCPTDGFNLHHRGVESNLLLLPSGETGRFKVCIYALSSEITDELTMEDSK